MGHTANLGCSWDTRLQGHVEYTAIWATGPCGIHSNLGHMRYTAIWAMWDTQPFETQLGHTATGPCGTHSHLGLRAIWDTQQFGPQGHMGYTAIWATGPYGIHSDLGHRAMWDTQRFGTQGQLRHRANWDIGPFSTRSTSYIGYL